MHWQSFSAKIELKIQVICPDYPSSAWRINSEELCHPALRRMLNYCVSFFMHAPYQIIQKCLVILDGIFTQTLSLRAVFFILFFFSQSVFLSREENPISNQRGFK
jgi:hypothetical protein